MILEQRINVEPNGCWRWLGTITTKGYGQITWQGRKQPAHRAYYEQAHGPVPAGLTLDHLCRNRWCCNPDHLEPVTNHENIMRGLVPSANRTHCKRGTHDITKPDAIYVDSDGFNRCHACRLETKARYRARNR